MRFRLSSLLWLTAILLATQPALKAQDQSPSPSEDPTQAQDPAQSSSESATPLQWGAFGVQGSASFGYRFTTIKGYEPMFEELYDLKQGPRLMDFNLFGRSDGSNPFADDFSLTMSGWGGDPYPSAQLTLSKHNLYDLRVNWRQAYFYWNQNDNVILPTLGITGLTNNHDWATVRKMGSVDLTLHATNNLRFHFQYYRTSFSGDTFTTFSPDFLGASDTWGFFARANSYFLFAPTFDNTNRFTGGFDYSWHAWNFHYDVGYQTFTENMSFDNVTSPERAIDTSDAPTAKELLSSASWTDYRRLTTPVSEFSYTGKPYSWLEMRGSYVFYRYQGPATLDQSFNGVGRTNIPGTTDAPYSVSQTGRAQVSEPNHIVEQGFTFDVKPWWDIDLDYRYSRFTTHVTGDYTSLFDGTTPAEETDVNQWRDGLHQLDFNMMFTPRPNLVIRPGITLFKADIEELENGEADNPMRTLRTRTVWPSLSVFYQPVKRFSLRGELQSYTSSPTYTAITPRTDVTGRVVGTLRLTDKFSFQDEMYVVNQQLLATEFHGKVHSNAAMLNYALNERYSLFAGFSYDNEFASGLIHYIRGTPPLSGSIRDQDINRVWQAGFEAKPAKYFGIRFTGNFDRATGVGEANGQNPVYGPLTFPYATGTVYFDFPRAGRLSVDLQRTYYIQQLLTGDNFSANMLTVRWTRNF